VVVHETDRLHERVAGRRPDERELSLLEILAHHLAERLAAVLRSVDDRRAVDELPDVRVEGTELPPDVQDRLGVLDDGIDLLPVADDAAVGEQRGSLRIAVPGDLLDLEVVERAAIPVTLAEDGQPAEPGLSPFEVEPSRTASGRREPARPTPRRDTGRTTPGCPPTCISLAGSRAGSFAGSVTARLGRPDD
jgi:hypothetical protein